MNHDGRGWWDPHSSAKGDIFDLVQFFDPSLNFGQVRKVLWLFVGLSPVHPEALRPETRTRPNRTPAARWKMRPPLRPGSEAWRYLAATRGLPGNVPIAAEAEDAVREGPYGSAWFAHRNAAGDVSHVEIRGPDYKGSLRGGNKSLFRLSRSSQPPA